MNMKKKALCLALALLLVALTACAPETVIRTVYVMDTFADISIYGGDQAMADRIEEALYDIESEISATSGKLLSINENGGGVLPDHAKTLLALSEKYYEETNGAFSPYLGSLIELWGVGSRNYVPVEEEISSALASSRKENVSESDGEVSLKNGARLNFGACGKGYATDVVKKILEEETVDGAIVSLGGNVYVHGRKPDGNLFRVAVRDPKGDENDWVLSLIVSDKFIISSGDYERFFEKDGVKYHHIFSPETGAPAESDLVAACVIADDGAMADAYSTAAFIMGREKALSFWREKGNFDLVLIGRDGVVTLTEGIGGNFVQNTSKGYIYEVEKR